MSNQGMLFLELYLIPPQKRESLSFHVWSCSDLLVFESVPQPLL